MRTRTTIASLCLLLAAASLPLVQAQTNEMNVSSTVPVVSVETSVPAEINIGSSAQFVITVKNTGKSPAESVSVQSMIPDTVEFLRANPAPSVTANQLVQFEIGDLPAGASRKIVMELLPQRHGPVDLATRAFFAASTQSALTVRKPEIAIDCQAQEEAIIGDEVTFSVVVQNIGDGPALDVVIAPEVPQLAYIANKAPAAIKIPNLPANTSKEYSVVARAIDVEYLEAGFAVTSQNGEEVRCGKRVKVLRPAIGVNVDGSRVTFLNREGKYAVRVWNPGDTTLDEVKVVLTLPPDLQVTTLSTAAKVDSVRNTLTWCIGVMEPGDEHVFMLKAKANAEGAQIQVACARTAMPNVNATDDHRTVVATRPEIDVAVLNSNEAIEVGSAEEFTIWMRNLGSKTARNVSVQAILPETLVPVDGESYAAQGQRMVYPQFDLAPGEEHSLTFRAASLNPGEHAVQAVVQSEGTALPTKAETTVYFFDEEELERLASGAPSVGTLR